MLFDPLADRPYCAEIIYAISSTTDCHLNYLPCHFDRREKSSGLRFLTCLRNDDAKNRERLCILQSPPHARALLQTVTLIFFLLFRSFSSGVRSLNTQNPKTSVSLIYEAIAATNATLWLAEDARLFEKYGLDTKVVHARGAVPD